MPVSSSVALIVCYVYGLRVSGSVDHRVYVCTNTHIYVCVCRVDYHANGLGVLYSEQPSVRPAAIGKN